MIANLCQELYAIMIDIISNNVTITAYKKPKTQIRNRQVFIENSKCFFLNETCVTVYGIEGKDMFYKDNNIHIPGVSDQKLMEVLRHCILRMTTRFYVT